MVLNMVKGLDFARALLEKYGWKEGKGLGRNENGIVEALKPELKFDKAGVGNTEASDQFTSQWWEKAYNKVAKTITIVKEKNKIKVQQENRDELFKSKDARPFSMYNPTDYNEFVKTHVLTGEGVVNVAEPKFNTEICPEENITIEAVPCLTDEEIFQACGGRTVHKGARHGLKLNGKLARIQRQEQEILLKLQSCQPNLDVSDLEKVEENQNSNRKRKIKNYLEGTANGMMSQCDLPFAEKEKQKHCPDDLDDSVKPSKKNKRRKAITEMECIETISNGETVNYTYTSETDIDPKTTFQKKKKKRKKALEEIENTGSKVRDTIIPESYKKRKRKKDEENKGVADLVIPNSSQVEPQKKQKKNKKCEEYGVTPVLKGSEVSAPGPQKKQKKKNKKR